MSLFIPILDNGMGLVRANYMQCMLMAASGRKIHFARLGHSHIEFARNLAVASFLETKCDQLLFIDGDMVFAPQDVARIEEAPEPIVAGAYTIRRQGLTLAASLYDPKDITKAKKFKVKKAGTGFMRIKREVFEKIIESGNVRKYRVNNIIVHEIFRREIEDDEIWNGEDYGFCSLARSLGFDIWLDLDIFLGHEGTEIFPTKDQQ